MKIPWEMIIEKLEEVGLQVTEGAKTGIEFMYPLAVRQAFYEGLLTIVFCLLLLVVVIWLLRKGYKVSKSNKKESEMGFPIMLASAIPFVIFMLEFKRGFMKVFNPKWYAIQQLLELLK
jgi:cbb3-type cytochrome oxidase subunit 3